MRCVLVMLAITGCVHGRPQLYVRSIELSGRTLIVTKCPFGDVVTQACFTESIALPAPRASAPR